MTDAELDELTIELDEMCRIRNREDRRDKCEIFVGSERCDDLLVLARKGLEKSELEQIGAAAVEVRKIFHDDSVSQSAYAKKKFELSGLCDAYLSRKDGGK